MRVSTLLIAASLLSGSLATAQAGCVTGAIVGGIAGHMVGHGKLGAAAGCVVGHHEAKKDQQRQAAPAPDAQPK